MTIAIIDRFQAEKRADEGRNELGEREMWREEQHIQAEVESGSTLGKVRISGLALIHRCHCPLAVDDGWYPKRTKLRVVVVADKIMGREGNLDSR